jgi:hypothetical protein
MGPNLICRLNQQHGSSVDAHHGKLHTM